MSIHQRDAENKLNHDLKRKFFFSMNNFSKQFVDYMMIFLMNLFSKYDQFFLIEIFRNLTEFQISIELIRMTIFFQKTINSIMQFCRIMFKILIDYINKKTMLFLNDVEIKKFKNISANYEKIAFNIRKKTLKHIQ